MIRNVPTPASVFNLNCFTEVTVATLLQLYTVKSVKQNKATCGEMTLIIGIRVFMITAAASGCPGGTINSYFLSLPQTFTTRLEAQDL